MKRTWPTVVPAFHLWLWERPFNLKGGGVWFVSKQNILIPNVAEKNILILVEEKKKNLIQSFCHNLMLNSGQKIRTLRDKKKIIFWLVLFGQKNSELKKPIAPFPLQVKWSVPYKLSNMKTSSAIFNNCAWIILSQNTSNLAGYLFIKTFV